MKCISYFQDQRGLICATKTLWGFSFKNDTKQLERVQKSKRGMIKQPEHRRGLRKQRFLSSMLSPCSPAREQKDHSHKRHPNKKIDYWV